MAFLLWARIEIESNFLVKPDNVSVVGFVMRVSIEIVVHFRLIAFKSLLKTKIITNKSEKRNINRFNSVMNTIFASELTKK